MRACRGPAREQESVLFLAHTLLVLAQVARATGDEATAAEAVPSAWPSSSGSVRRQRGLVWAAGVCQLRPLRRKRTRSANESDQGTVHYASLSCKRASSLSKALEIICP